MGWDTNTVETQFKGKLLLQSFNKLQAALKECCLHAGITVPSMFNADMVKMSDLLPKTWFSTFQTTVSTLYPMFVNTYIGNVSGRREFTLNNGTTKYTVDNGTPYELVLSAYSKIIVSVNNGTATMEQYGGQGGNSIYFTAWTQATILAFIGDASRLSAPSSFVCAKWCYQQYKILNALKVLKETWNISLSLPSYLYKQCHSYYGDQQYHADGRSGYAFYSTIAGGLEGGALQGKYTVEELWAMAEWCSSIWFSPMYYYGHRVNGDCETYSHDFYGKHVDWIDANYDLYACRMKLNPNTPLTLRANGFFNKASTEMQGSWKELKIAGLSRTGFLYTLGIDYLNEEGEVGDFLSYAVSGAPNAGAVCNMVSPDSVPPKGTVHDYSYDYVTCLSATNGYTIKYDVTTCWEDNFVKATASEESWKTFI